MNQSTGGYTRSAGISYLVRGHKKRHKRPSGKKSRVSRIPHRVDITECATHIDLRTQAGRWEVDTVVSGQSKVRAAVLVERKSRFFMVIRMKDKTGSAMHEAVVLALPDLPA
jgi:IS30 family transposase